MCNQNQAILILGEVHSCCAAIFGNAIQDAFLYGSYARGDYHAESDVDILLTVNMMPEAIAKLREPVGVVASNLSLKHDVTVSVTVKSFAQFNEYSGVLPYYQNVLREGIRYAS